MSVFKDLIDAFEKVRDIAATVHSAELTLAIADIKLKLADVQAELSEANGKISDLRRELAQRRDILIVGGRWNFLRSESADDRLPICEVCATEGAIIHMSHHDPSHSARPCFGFFKCPKCSRAFFLNHEETIDTLRQAAKNIESVAFPGRCT